jgi:predicted anti-sigma-YlaC factor YlaD
MNCKDIKLLLSAYQDNELDAIINKEVSEHLSICENCQREFNNLKELNNRLMKLETHHLPLNFSSNIMSEIKAKHSNKKSFGGIRNVSFLYSFVFLLFIIIGMIFIQVKPDSINNKITKQNDTYMTSLLSSEQQLGLLDIQDNIMGIVEDEVSYED